MAISTTVVVLIMSACFLVLIAAAVVFMLADKQRRDNDKQQSLREEKSLLEAWSDQALLAIRHTGMNPPRASRALAMVHLAMYDAWAGTLPLTERVYSMYGYADNGSDVPSTAVLSDGRAAVAQAAHDVMLALFGNSVKSDIGELLSRQLGSTDANAEAVVRQQNGSVWGAAVAARVLSMRAADGWNAVVAPPAVSDPLAAGEWQPEAGKSFLEPQWGAVTPFALLNAGTQFPLPAPPAPETAEFEEELAQVRLIGSLTSQTRSQNQTNIANFWANGSYTETPPGHLNRMMWQILKSAPEVRDFSRTMSTLRQARLLALFNCALADAAISCWRAKYDFNRWRPNVAIHTSAGGDPDWQPLLSTPPFPEYVSGHSTFSGAAETALAALLKLDAGGATPLTFSVESGSQPGYRRTYTSLRQASQESADSRLYGGIHFQSGNQQGLVLGRQIGTYVATNMLALKQ